MNGLLFLASVLAGTCLNPNRVVKAPVRGDLATLVQKIEQACPEVKRDDQDLLDDVSMKQLHDHPEPYFDQAILLVRDARASLAAKLIVVYGMQCLALEKYLVLGYAVLSSVETGKSSPQLLQTTLLPGAHWSTRLSSRYGDTDVRRFLQAVKKSPASDDRLDTLVAEMLSGDLDRANRRAPKGYWGTWSCPEESKSTKR